MREREMEREIERERMRQRERVKERGTENDQVIEGEDEIEILKTDVSYCKHSQTFIFPYITIPSMLLSMILKTLLTTFSVSKRHCSDIEGTQQVLSFSIKFCREQIAPICG